MGVPGTEPRRNKVSPLPAGKGAGDGGKNQLKTGLAGDKKGKPPLGIRLAGAVSAARVQPRDARGEAPCIKNNLPFPTGKGVRDRGQKRGRQGRRARRKASPRGCRNGRAAGDLPLAPPAGDSGGRKLPPRCAASPFCTNPAAIFGTGCGLTGAAETYIIGRETFDDSGSPVKKTRAKEGQESMKKLSCLLLALLLTLHTARRRHRPADSG